jgi:hypothetical protein
MKMIKNKTVTIIGALILVFMLVMPADVFSQGPPPWAPAHGYRAKTRHIYFPDHNFYFDLQKKVYIYVNGGKWQVGIRLPSIFGTINLGKSTQIQLDYFGSYPQYFNNDHKIKYKYKKKQKNAPNYKSKPKFKDTNNGRKDKENDNRGKGNKGKGNDK